MKDLEDQIETINDDMFVNQIDDDEWNSLIGRLIPLWDFALKIERFLQKSHSNKLEEEDTSKDKVIKRLEALKPERYVHSS